MENLKCANCNSVSFTEHERYFECDYCGGRVMKDPREYGVVKSAAIAVSSSAASLLERADLYWELGQTGKAKRLYQQVLDLDATVERARERSR
ncbi:MAG: hypothetical protein IJ087_13790 [Eggerthellaceae bacterium]|nr:hypothetical protein [Eggerthellaceae bacterium]